MATLAGVRLASLHVPEGLALHVRDQVDVLGALAPVSAQAMDGPVLVAAPDSVEAHMARATAPMRLQMARHVTPRR